jgi:PhnB protein
MIPLIITDLTSETGQMQERIMTKLNTYLNFPGNTEEVFNFYKSVFGGEFSGLVRYRDMPMPGYDIQGAEDKIMHIALPIGDDVLMASDAIESLGQKVTQGNNAYIAIVADSKADADRLYNGLSAGGEIEMEMADQPWGDYYGSFKDRYGTLWMVMFHPSS